MNLNEQYGQEQKDANTVIHEANRYYLDLDTLERVRGTYAVRLKMPATYDGYVEVESTSEAEAVKMALDMDMCEIDWDFDDPGDHYNIEGAAEGQDDPPEGAILVEMPYHESSASIDALFAPDEALPTTVTEPRNTQCLDEAER